MSSNHRWLGVWLLVLAGCADGTPPEAFPTGGSLAAPHCSGDNDGVVEVGELDFQPGPVAPYAVVASGGPALDGAMVGTDPRWRRWDFTSAGFDRVEEVPLQEPGTAWWYEQLPDATLAMPTGGTSDGAEPATIPAQLVLASQPRELAILGVASAEPDELLLIYDRPVPFLRFPLRYGNHWRSAVRPAAGSRLGTVLLDQVEVEDRYELSVTGEGTLRLPGMQIDGVLALSVQLERWIAGRLAWSNQEVFLVHECLGVVARRSSSDGIWWVIWYPR